MYRSTFETFADSSMILKRTSKYIFYHVSMNEIGKSHLLERKNEQENEGEEPLSIRLFCSF
jgi:hypothetical protein